MPPRNSPLIFWQTNRSLSDKRPPLKLVADECISVGIVASLREEGYDVRHVLEEAAGSSDDDVLSTAHSQDRIVLTEDKDFGDLVYRLRKPAKGIIFIRIPIADRHLKWPRLRKLLAEFPERLPGHFVVLEKDKVRFRPLLFPL